MEATVGGRQRGLESEGLRRCSTFPSRQPSLKQRASTVGSCRCRRSSQIRNYGVFHLRGDRVAVRRSHDDFSIDGSAIPICANADSSNVLSAADSERGCANWLSSPTDFRSFSVDIAVYVDPASKDAIANRVVAFRVGTQNCTLHNLSSHCYSLYECYESFIPRRTKSRFQCTKLIYADESF